MTVTASGRKLRGAPPRCVDCDRKLPLSRARISLAGGLWRCGDCQYELERDELEHVRAQQEPRLMLVR